MSVRYQKFVPEKPQIHPLSISVDEALSTELEKQQQGFLKCTVCCGIIAAVVLIIAVVMIVLGFTVLHIKNPKLRMNSVAIIGLDQVNSTDLLNRNANLTVVADVSMKNTNVEKFKFETFNSSLVYRETVVGVADVPGGVVDARKTMRLKVVYEMMMAKMAGDPQFGSDFTAGKLMVRSYTRVNGRVNILNIIKRKVTVTMNCSIAINVTSWGIADQDCKSHVDI
ncbi:unnamed protein product [Lactuca virosa]|uniref:Late embryogenesis abundant protein LEA-2 subgroup domain-containing protein n=1 Tax=Lactuca virosa TaxID=75947 RepID=A0AAU9PMC5_9ASTR|nr:unnamed protein product [Lactuca virosa]